MKTININKGETLNLLYKEFSDQEVFINLEDDSKLNMLYFSRFKEDLKINIRVGNNVIFNFDLILMTGNVNDDITIEVFGEESKVTLKTLSLAKEAKNIINQNVIHRAPYSKSEVINNGISFVNGHNEFNVVGKIDSKMTASDVRQITKGLILDKSGSCLAKPILLIDYYDVKAYHGATIGKINDEDLFYLMSRGLTKKEASMLVIGGLLEPFIKEIESEQVKAEVMDTYMSYFGE